jgi:hypothetical protein
MIRVEWDRPRVVSEDDRADVCWACLLPTAVWEGFTHYVKCLGDMVLFMSLRTENRREYLLQTL